MVKNQYVACALCGMNKIFLSKKRAEKGKGQELEWPSFSLSDAHLLQVREGGGKKGGTGAKGRGKAPGSGFYTVESECLTLSQMIERREYDNVLAGMKQQLLRVIKESLEIGFITMKDLR